MKKFMLIENNWLYFRILCIILQCREIWVFELLLIILWEFEEVSLDVSKYIMYKNISMVLLHNALVYIGDKNSRR